MKIVSALCLPVQLSGHFSFITKDALWSSEFRAQILKHSGYYAQEMGLVLEGKYRKEAGKGSLFIWSLPFSLTGLVRTSLVRWGVLKWKYGYLPLPSLVLSLSSGELQNINLLLFHCFIFFLCTHWEALKYKDHAKLFKNYYFLSIFQKKGIKTIGLGLDSTSSNIITLCKDSHAQNMKGL